MDITAMQHKDLDEVMCIESRAYEFPWVRTHFVSALNAKEQDAYVCRLNGEIIAYAVFLLAADEMQLLNITVSPEHQNQSVGTFLLTEMEAIANQKGAVEVHLEVRQSNTAALALYHKLNYAALGERVNYYPCQNGRENAVLMAKTLSLTE